MFRPRLWSPGDIVDGPFRAGYLRPPGRQRGTGGPGHISPLAHRHLYDDRNPAFLPGGEAARQWEAATGALVRRSRLRVESGLIFGGVAALAVGEVKFKL